MNRKILAIAFALLLIPGVVRPTTISRPNSYTSGTVIDASQVNADFNTIYTDHNGSINSSNIAANGVAFSNLAAATQQFWSYRRPVLVSSTTTTVDVERGITGTSSQVMIIFPDGTMRTDTSDTRLILDVSRVAALTGTAQSGLLAAVSNNTWYGVYAVKSQVNSTDIVIVGGTIVPIQANYSSLNSNFGTNSWVYLGMIRYGDDSGTANVILSFVQNGNVTRFRNLGSSPSAIASAGMALSQCSSCSSITHTVSKGTGASNIPNNVDVGWVTCGFNNTTSLRITNNTSIDIFRIQGFTSGLAAAQAQVSLLSGDTIVATPSGSTNPGDIWLNGFVDRALGTGSNPFL